MSEIVLLLVLGTAIWVAYDSSAHRIPIDGKPYSANNGAIAWFLSMALLWIASFPYYLVKRSKVLTARAGGGGSPQVQTVAGKGRDVIGELERLAALKEKGVLSDAEFQAQKARLLGGSTSASAGSLSSRQEAPRPPPQVATAACPFCGKGIPLSSVSIGKNTCPHCRKVFEAE